MTEILFTTMDVARMLQVDKSTVKRWTDEGKLKCFRTPGGHRKFRAEDLYQFMSEYNYGVSPVNLYPQFASDEAVIRRIIAQKEFNVLASVCFSSAIKGKRDEVVRLFSEIYRYGLPLPQIFDEVLRPSLRRIDDLQRAGKVSAAERLLAINALSAALVLLSDAIVKPASTGRKAIIALVGNVANDIELKALDLLLESMGIDVLNLGGVASMELILQLARTQQPNYVFLVSVESIPGAPGVAEYQNLLAELQHVDGRLILGGGGYPKDMLDEILRNDNTRFCSTYREYATVQHEGPGRQQNVNQQR